MKKIIVLLLMFIFFFNCFSTNNWRSVEDNDEKSLTDSFKLWGYKTWIYGNRIDIEQPESSNISCRALQIADTIVFISEIDTLIPTDYVMFPQKRDLKKRFKGVFRVKFDNWGLPYGAYIEDKNDTLNYMCNTDHTNYELIKAYIKDDKLPFGLMKVGQSIVDIPWLNGKLKHILSQGEKYLVCIDMHNLEDKDVSRKKCKNSLSHLVIRVTLNEGKIECIEFNDSGYNYLIEQGFFFGSGCRPTIKQRVLHILKLDK